MEHTMHLTSSMVLSKRAEVICFLNEQKLFAYFIKVILVYKSSHGIICSSKLGGTRSFTIEMALEDLGLGSF